IKQHKPHYNILLKDDKAYPFIRIDIKSLYPDITISQKSKDDGAIYLGPFGGRKNSRSIIDEIKKALLLPDCSRKFPRDIGSGRPCLNYHLHKCAGWCTGEPGEDEYRSRIEQAMKILQGKSDMLLEELERSMEDESSSLNFEKAAEFRDRIALIKLLANKQRVLSLHYSDLDAVGFARGFKSCFTVLSYIDGNLVNKQTEIINEPVETDEEAVAAFISQYYTSSDASIPATILIDQTTESIPGLETFLSERCGRKVEIVSPVRGERRRLIDYAVLNSEEEIKRIISADNRNMRILGKVRNRLDLADLPHRIEAYDISNLGSTGIVAAMTVFREGKKSKKDYRKFRFREQQIQNDLESMYSCISRRFSEYLKGEKSFAEMPDLILIDGGTEQTSAAVEAMTALGVKTAVFGMVKDDKHRTRALVTPAGLEVDIAGDSELFSFIGNIQEETHRSAIEYQKKIRNEQFASVLDKIPGIGAKRKGLLLDRYKTVKAIKNASQEELTEILPRDAAAAVYVYFHETDKGDPE
ncbi:MAG: excinuclease ABC subunit UvrC, partial [Oscillospiraceae bacterium]|nr:excinuclease ABC subunit UvrC [Oscillospiraceae bacterium]